MTAGHLKKKEASILSAPSRIRLWGEFLLLYVVAPLVMAAVLPPMWMFPVLFVVTICGLVLLQGTRGFHWADLLQGRQVLREHRTWRVLVMFAAVTELVSFLVVMATNPDALFGLLRHRPGLMAMIIVLYPVLSALPQEILFRVLFFRRYGVLLPGPHLAIVINALLFALAHLMYWSWVVTILTFAGGMVFAWAYEMRRSFALALLLHSIAGWILFVFGMGIYFYAGNVVRPF